MTTIRAVAHTNIALVKYWGKNPGPGNIPAMGSLSLTLDRFWSTTQVTPSDQDSFSLNGVHKDDESARVFAHIDFFRRLTGKNLYLNVEARNEVLTSSGLASSASGFAALTLALVKAFELDVDGRELSRLARRGSGSAARSIFGGFVRMHGGPGHDDEHAFAEPIESPLDVRMIVLECAKTPKAISSREAMVRVVRDSVFYDAFLARHPQILDAALDCLKNGDLEQLGILMEQSTMQMHATMLGCREPFWYFNQTTVAALNAVRELRKSGLFCFFTMDAGPHVKVLCDAKVANQLSTTLAEVDGVTAVTLCAPGKAAYLS